MANFVLSIIFIKSSELIKNSFSAFVSSILPYLAFRYGCRARNCGVCTIDINDRPRIACRSRVKDGDKLSAIATLPVLSDLVVRRDGIARQMRGLKTSGQGNDLNVDAPDVYHELTACIECYACLDNCPMHARNFDDKLPGEMETELPDPSIGYKYGNPFSLLKTHLSFALFDL